MMNITRESGDIVLIKEEEEEDEDEEDALSLCDLPNNEENQTKKEASGSVSDAQLEDFDFNSCGGNLLKESDMCTADEIFYRVTTPGIALQDLKNRGNRDNSGSRNSTSSSGSSNNDNRMRIILSKKKKQRFSLGSCKCSANAVETVLPSNVLIMNSNSTITKTRKVTEGHEHEDKKNSSENIKATKKQAMSRHRTFEWLKQLSLEGPVDET
ncbi:hypothetical protein K7X08_019529 [Anisodus acutangulus]|uniref:Uncharacterized protein n=1 Tax=Anisodus acutangulus TaxID=402998 RepID=A0A9Q1MV42_9SOLA|nr:hypothetical protein K7X08_019529 [Anisodus acutangulus]